MFVDYGFTLPAPLTRLARLTGAATLWGLHLSGDEAGALIAFPTPPSMKPPATLLTDETPPDSVARSRSASGWRQDGIAARLRAVDAVTRMGMEAGAGVPMMPTAGRARCRSGWRCACRTRPISATFISYVRNENVDLDWLPEIQPMFYAAYQVTRDRARTFGAPPIWPAGW